MKRSFLSMAFVGSIIAARIVVAAEPVPPDSVAMTVPEVQVQALRGRDLLRQIPAPAFMLGRAELAKTGADRVATTLARLPGFHGYGQSGIGEPRVLDPRGFTANGESSYLKLLVNGQDVRGVENGDVDWDWVMTDDVERVEVIQGPGAWLYGDASEGGIVNLVRRKPATGFTSDCMLRAGSFGLRSGNFVLSGGDEQRRLGLRAGGRIADGYRDRTEESAFTGGADLGWDLSARTRIGLDLSVLDSKHQDPGALTADQLREDRNQADTQTDYTHARRWVSGLHFVHRPDASQEWRVSPYVRTEEVDQIRTIFFETKSHPTQSVTFGGEASWQGRMGAMAVNAGLQAERARLQSDYRSLVDGSLEARGTGIRDSYSAFANGRLGLGERASARLGIRGDIVQVGPLERLDSSEIPARTLSAASPFLALMHDVGKTGSVWASASTAFRAPTLNQLFDQRPFFNPFLGGTIVISNPDLDPQRSLNFELGGRCEGPNGRLASVTLYSAQVRDEIDFDLSTFSYANLSESWHRGIEAAVVQPFSAQWTATASGAWTPTTIEGGPDDGKQINAVPEGMAYGSLRWTPTPRWSIEGGVRYTGRQYLDKANEHALPDYATLELAASARLPRAQVTLRMGNVLDREYEESGYIGAIGEERFYPAAGRSLSLGVSFD